MLANSLRSFATTVAAVAMLAVLLTPLCGGLQSAHACPMNAAMQHDGCQGPAGPGMKQRPMDCCVAPQAGSPPATPSLTLLLPAPVPQPAVAPAIVIASTTQPAPATVAAEQAVDLFSLHSSLLL